MTEWLLSGHNPQETSGVAHPLTKTINVQGLNEEFVWSTAMIGGGTEGFDLSIPPALTVQSRLYLNVSYFMRNVALVMPFDPESIGAPKDILPPYGSISLRRKLLLPWHLYTLYRWGKRIYQNDVPAIAQIERETYTQLRAAKEPPLAVIEHFFEPQVYDYTYQIGKAHIAVSAMVTLVDSVVREKRPELLGMFVGNRTTTSMMTERIWELRGIAQQCGSAVTEKLQAGVTELDVYRKMPAAAPFVTGVEKFLQDYGHRGFRYEVDLDAERLDDHPEYVILAVAGQLDVPIPPPQRADAAHRQAEETLRALPLIERAFWKKLLAWGQQLIAWRENSKSLISMRQAIIALAARHLAHHYYPNRPDDILLFYTRDEFLDFVHSQGQQRVPDETLSRRRAQYELHVAQAPPPELIWYDPDTQHWRPVETETATPHADEAQTIKQFHGIPVSAGVGPVEGVAVVTSDPIEAGQQLMELKNEVILVTRFTDPAWSSLFGRLSGVVTELGGVVSHAAVIARENGLPAVVGVSNILHHVRAGQRIRIDGKTGTVEILD